MEIKPCKSCGNKKPHYLCLTSDPPYYKLVCIGTCGMSTGNHRTYEEARQEWNKKQKDEDEN